MTALVHGAAESGVIGRGSLSLLWMLRSPIIRVHTIDELEAVPAF